MEKKVCPACGFQIFGRTDKVYCSDSCRTNYNNLQNKKENQIISRINKRLKNNRRILVGLMADGLYQSMRSSLEEKGFDFRYFTSSIQKGEDDLMHYSCYDIGYMILENDMVKIIEQENPVN